MTFNTDPDNYEYQVPPLECDRCFDPNLTSKSLFLCFADIQIGAAWNPGDPEPPNGTFEVQAVAQCQWQGFHNGIRFDYIVSAVSSLLQVWIVPVPILFNRLIMDTCKSYFTNSLVAPAGKYFGGYGLAVAPLPGGAFDMTNMVELMGMEPSENLWVNPRPIDADRSVHALFSSEQSISVLIKVQH